MQNFLRVTSEIILVTHKKILSCLALVFYYFDINYDWLKSNIYIICKTSHSICVRS